MMSNHVFEVTNDNFEQAVMQAELPILVEFTADWCPPCKMLAPVIEALAVIYENQMRVGSVDSDLYMDLTERFGVLGLPTLILFKKGVPVEQMVGFMPRHKIEARLTRQVALVDTTKVT